METTFQQKLSIAVKTKRKQLKLTQQELAGISGVGMRFIVELEGGKKESLQIGKIQQVLKRLGLTLQVSEKSRK